MRTPKPLVVFVVGHEKWGKSYTFRALCKDFRSRRTDISGTYFSVRRSSNDDITRTRRHRYRNFIESLSPTTKPLVVAALCPKFRGISESSLPEKYADPFLRNLQSKGYRLSFWVIEHEWPKPNRPVGRVSAKEISVLREYAKSTRGQVTVFSKMKAEASARAKELCLFIEGML